MSNATEKEETQVTNTLTTSEAYKVNESIELSLADLLDEYIDYRGLYQMGRLTPKEVEYFYFIRSVLANVKVITPKGRLPKRPRVLSDREAAKLYEEELQKSNDKGGLRGW